MLDLPFLFFGHSMGALLAFSCARTLRERKLRLPEHVIVSARRPPQFPNLDRAAVSMNDADFISMIRRRGGTPPEILGEPELMARLIPSIRADFALVDSYRYAAASPLERPITAFTGKDDTEAPELALREWAIHTTGPFSIENFAGGHFFINAQRDRVIGRVARIVDATLRASGQACRV
jgi:surfactin synthase thioesterase subunit